MKHALTAAQLISTKTLINTAYHATKNATAVQDRLQPNAKAVEISRFLTTIQTVKK
jgi:hypothetical protein